MQLTEIAQMPDVHGALLAESNGMLIESVHEENAEAVASVLGFMCTRLSQAASGLGLGDPTAVVVAEQGSYRGVFILDGALVSATAKTETALNQAGEAASRLLASRGG